MPNTGYARILSQSESGYMILYPNLKCVEFLLGVVVWFWVWLCDETKPTFLTFVKINKELDSDTSTIVQVYNNSPKLLILYFFSYCWVVSSHLREIINFILHLLKVDLLFIKITNYYVRAMPRVRKFLFINIVLWYDSTKYNLVWWLKL